MVAEHGLLPYVRVRVRVRVRVFLLSTRRCRVLELPCLALLGTST